MMLCLPCLGRGVKPTGFHTKKGTRTILKINFITL
jgi:hypothetical protein